MVLLLMDDRVWADKLRLQSVLVQVYKLIRKIGQFKLTVPVTVWSS